MEKEEKSIREIVEELIEKSEHEEALTMLYEHFDYQNSQFCFLIAKIYFAIKDYRMSEEWVLNILETEEEFYEGQMLLAEIHKKKNREEEAANIYVSLIEKGFTKVFPMLAELRKEQQIKNPVFKKIWKKFKMIDRGIIYQFLIVFSFTLFAMIVSYSDSYSTPSIKRVWPFVFLDKGIFTDFDYTEFIYINFFTFLILRGIWLEKKEFNIGKYFKTLMPSFILFMVIFTIISYGFYDYDIILIKEPLLATRSFHGFFSRYGITEAVQMSFISSWLSYANNDSQDEGFGWWQVMYMTIFIGWGITLTKFL